MVAVSLTLGTANLGLAYGSAIRRNLPDADHVEAMLRRAFDCGFGAIDTARAYGLAEERIGRHLASGRWFAADRVATKLAPLPEIDANSPPEFGRALATASLAQSRAALGVMRLQRVLLHRASHLDDAGGAVWQVLREERAQQRIVEIGASVQSVDELKIVAGRPDVDAVQVPCNILDWRFDSPRTKALLAARDAPIKVDVRSIFLQGVLTAGNTAAFPALSLPFDREGIVAWLQSAADRFTGGAVDALCLRFAASLGWVSALVVAADTPAQIDRLASILALGPLDRDVLKQIRRERPRVPETLLNPAEWQATATIGVPQSHANEV